MNNQPNYYPIPIAPQPQPPKQKASGAAITALVLSIISVVLIVVLFFVSIGMWASLLMMQSQKFLDMYTEALDEITAAEEGGITFDDPAVEAAIREALNKPHGTVTEKDMLGITILDIMPEGPSVFSIDVLRYCHNLAELWVSHKSYNETALSDISALRDLHKLHTLYLYSTNVTDITPLEGHTNLRKLILIANNIRENDSRELEGHELIETFSELRELYLNGFYNIDDISSISNLTNLTDLSLLNCSVTDVKPLSKMTKLEWLDLEGNNILSVSPLENLTNLRFLRIDRLESGDIKPLENLTNLKSLLLSNFKIKSIEPIKKLTNLEYADLCNLGLTPAQQNELEKALPNCEFNFYD